MPSPLLEKGETVTMTISSPLMEKEFDYGHCKPFWKGEDMVAMVMPFTCLGKEGDVMLMTISGSA